MFERVNRNSGRNPINNNIFGDALQSKEQFTSPFSSFQGFPTIQQKSLSKGMNDGKSKFAKNQLIQLKESRMAYQESQRMVSSGTSTKMPKAVQAKMESGFSTDFSKVNIHKDSQNASEIGALAYTQGKDIHFAPGHYQPESKSGQELLGHELIHVVQQSQGKVSPTIQTKGVNINNDPLLEKEADDMGVQVAQGKFVNPQLNNLQGTNSSSIIQRDATSEAERIKKLNLDYENSLTKSPRNYEEIAELLNAFSKDDILSRLAKLGKGEVGSIYLGATTNKKVGSNSQVALLTKEAYLDLNLNNEVKKENWKEAGKYLNDYNQDNPLNKVNGLKDDKLELLLKEACQDLILRIRLTPAFQALDPAVKSLAEEIISEIGKRPLKEQYTYYLPYFKNVFVTKEKPPAEISKETEAVTTNAAAEEKVRISKPEAAKNLDLEEKASKDPSRKWTAIKGQFGGGTYYVDKTSASNIVVRAKILLTPKGTGTAKSVENIKSMEDAIEKAASTKGYLVDIEFVDNDSDPDTFKVDVNPGAWEVATNWGGGDPLVYAHELHHLFAFPLDRYNYIESHSGNESMEIKDRLHWFREELKKPPGYNDDTSIMNSASHPNDSDVATVAGIPLADRKAAMAAKP